MTKKEIYNTAVDMYKKTGQGLPGFIKMKIGRKELDELVDEGKLKVITQRYSYLPDDEWYCLTGVYCAEAEMVSGNPKALNFIRIYLNGDIGDKRIEKFFEKNPKEREKYDKEYQVWLEKNRDILEKSFQIEKI